MSFSPRPSKILMALIWIFLTSIFAFSAFLSTQNNPRLLGDAYAPSSLLAIERSPFLFFLFYLTALTIAIFVALSRKQQPPLSKKPLASRSPWLTGITILFMFATSISVGIGLDQNPSFVIKYASPMLLLLIQFGLWKHLASQS